jgi:hypothetical protein
MSPSEADQGYVIDGNFGDYDGGGLVVDYANTNGRSAFKTLLTKIYKSNVISVDVRAIIIEGGFYNPTLNIFSHYRLVRSTE